MDIEKAKILESILDRFKGNVRVHWADLREEFAENMHQYYVIENNINYLIGEGVLEKDHTTTGDALKLTKKGLGIYTDPENLGYISMAKKEFANLVWKRALQIIVGLSAILGTILLIYPCLDESSIDQSSTPNDQQQIIIPSKIQPETLSVNTGVLDTLSIMPEEKSDTNTVE